MPDFIQTLIDDAKKLLGDAEAGQYPASRPGPTASVDELLAYKPTSLADAVTHLQQLHDAIGTIAPDDAATIGKILIAIGGIIEGFFPQWQQIGVFLIELGTALESGGGTGSVGPIRLGNLGVTVNWAPWSAPESAPAAT